MSDRPRAGDASGGTHPAPIGARRTSALQVEADRLVLRPITAAAAAALVADRPAASELLGASLPADWPHANLLDFLPQLAAAGDAVQPFGAWVIVERATDEVVGDIGFHGLPDERGQVEIGYAVVPSRRLRGYAGEALAALVAFAATQPGVRQITARCEPSNVGSIRTLERGAFERLGERDGLIEWRRPV
jgi:[ribosomal protein S5]-alanine N-acetyltransferase